MFVVLLKAETCTVMLFNIIIIPPYSFINSLPSAIRFRKCGDNNTTYSELLDIGEERAIYSNPDTPIAFELMVPGYVNTVFRYSQKDIVIYG